MSNNNIFFSINEFFTIIQLMHSFEVNIKICQPENSDVHRGLTNPDVNRKRMHQLFCYMKLSLFS